MATDVERLVVSLEASITKYERAMQRALGQTNSTARKIESRFDKMNRGLSRQFAGLNGRLVAAFAGAASLRGAQSLVDAATRTTNALKVAGLEGEELTRVYDQLFASAQRNAAPLESLVTLYGRAVLVQKELGVSTDQLLGFTDNIAVALRVAGVDAQSASGALLQLSQALGSGVVRAEEFSSMLEGAPTILQAAAAGIKEAEGSVAKLRTIMLDGELSSRALFDGIEAGSVIMEEKLAGAELTVSQAFVRLRNVLEDTAGELNTSSGATERMAEALENLGSWIEQTDFSPLINGAMNFGSALIGVIEKIMDVSRAAGETFRQNLSTSPFMRQAEETGIAERWKVNKGELTPEAIQDYATRMGLGASAKTTPKTERLPENRRTITLDDPRYKIDPASGKGRGGRGGGERENEYERETEKIRERTEALRVEAQTVGDSTFEIERRHAALELEQAAEAAGLEITPKRRERIEELSSAYARQVQELERIQEAQDRVDQAAADSLSAIKDGFMSAITGAESFDDALKNIGKRLLEIALSNAFDSIFSPAGSGAGGILGGLGALLGFASGTPNTGGVRGQPRGIVHGQEAVIPLPGNGKVPVQLSVPPVPSAVKGSTEIIRVVLQDDSGRMAQIADQQIQTRSGAIVRVAVQQANHQVVPTMGRYQRERAGGDYRR